jgi:hypothetical protein
MADELLTPRVPAWVKVVAFLGGPLAWTLHLFACYFVVALACTSEWAGATLAIALLTIGLAALAIATGVFALRRWRRVQHAASWTHALNEAGGEEGLLFLVGVMLAALFALLIVMNGISPLLVPVCAP